MSRYRVDPDRGRFTVQAFAAGLLSAFGHDPTFAVRSYGGEVRIGATAETLELEITIDAGSLDLEDRVRDSDRREIEARMRGEVLETSVHREITYRGGAVGADAISPGRYRTSIAGDLAIRGITRPHPIDAELVVFADGLRLVGGGVLRMFDWGIRPVTALGGAVKLKNELKISFDLAALPETS